MAKYKVAKIVADSEASTLIQGIQYALIKNHIGLTVENAIKGKITGRISLFNSLIAQQRFKVMRRCTATISALENAVYDTKSMEDKRLDNGTTNIDSLDSMEYTTEPYAKELQAAILFKR